MGVMSAWLGALAIITWRNRGDPLHKVAGLPIPADYLASFAIYGILGLPSGDFRRPAAAMAWGYTFALFLNLNLGPLTPSASSPQGSGTKQAQTVSKSTASPARALTPGVQTASGALQ